MNLKKLIFIFVALVLNGCASSPIKSFVSDKPTSLDVNRINEIYRIQESVGDQVWPGFGKAPFKFVLVGRTYQWAFNVDPLPNYYKVLELPPDLNKAVNSVAVTETYRDEFGEKKENSPETLYNSYSKEMTAGHFKHSIYLVKTLDEYHRDGDDQAVEEWIHISMHELFHTFQDQFVNYTPEFLHSIETTIKKKLRNDEGHIALLQPELALLAKASCSDSKPDIKKFMQKALKLRKKRWAYIQKNYDFNPAQWERYDAWAEGTAHYIEHMIMARVAQFEPKTLLKNDPYFRQFVSYSDESDTRWCAEIGDVSKKSYWYSLGFAYSLVLDKIQPEWKSEKPDKKMFFDSNFKKLGLL